MFEDHGEAFLPALQGIHQLAGRLKTSAHQESLLAHDDQCILQKPRLVLDRRRRRHSVLQLVDDDTVNIACGSVILERWLVEVVRSESVAEGWKDAGE